MNENGTRMSTDAGEQLGTPTASHRTRLQGAAAAAARAGAALEYLAANRVLVEIAMDARTEAVAQARLDGDSWADIGRALGVTKQAAQARYGAKPERDDAEGAQAPKVSRVSHYEYRDINGNVQGHLVKMPGPPPDPSRHARAGRPGRPSAGAAGVPPVHRPARSQKAEQDFGRKEKGGQRNLTIVSDN